MNGTSSRLLTLLSLLQARRDWPGSELAERLEVSRRTVRRDVERLRELGYPVDSLTGPAGGYRLRAGAAMPPLLLDDEEAIAIAVGLRTAARSSVDRDRGDLAAGAGEARAGAAGASAPAGPRARRGRASALPDGGPTVDPQHLSVLAAACRDSERVRFAYRGREGAESRREVEPHSLVNLGRRWYLLAWDRGREDWRTLPGRPPRASGLDRGPLRAARAAGAATRRPTSPQSISSAPHRYEARVTVHAPADELRKRVPPTGDDRAARRATAASTAPATTTSTGSRCGSRCSAPSSRSTSRRS